MWKCVCKRDSEPVATDWWAHIMVWAGMNCLFSVHVWLLVGEQNGMIWVVYLTWLAVLLFNILVQDYLGEPAPKDTYTHSCGDDHGMINLTFWVSWCKGANALTIWLDSTHLRDYQCPHLHHPHNFYARYLSCRNPSPIYPGLGQASSIMGCIQLPSCLAMHTFFGWMLVL